MLLNQQQLRDLKIIPGTRLLEDPLGLQGTYVMDYAEPDRRWTIQWLLAPVRGRFLGGIRAKLIDEKGFISFINQRDLEVSLGHAKPGDYCPWCGTDYASPADDEWLGLCCDTEDLQDDLFERECWLRQQLNQPWLPTGLEIKRHLHLDERNDVEELNVLLGDINRLTGEYPDSRFETVLQRWSRVERNPIIWRRL